MTPRRWRWRSGVARDMMTNPRLWRWAGANGVTRIIWSRKRRFAVFITTIVSSWASTDEMQGSRLGAQSVGALVIVAWLLSRKDDGEARQARMGGAPREDEERTVNLRELRFEFEELLTEYVECLDEGR